MYVCKYVCMENQTQTSLRFLGERPCKYIHSHMYECVHGCMYVNMLISSALSHISFMYACVYGVKIPTSHQTGTGSSPLQTLTAISQDVDHSRKKPHTLLFCVEEGDILPCQLGHKQNYIPGKSCNFRRMLDLFLVLPLEQDVPNILVQSHRG